MPRILLLLPSATYRAPDFLDAARRLGAEVVVASDHRSTLSGVMGPRWLHLPLRDAERAAAAIVEHAAGLPLDAIVAVDDQGVLAAALAAVRLGLPANPPDAVLATRDKARLRERLHGHVAQPAFRVVSADDDLTAAVTAVGEPCVLKPVALSASRGVIRVDDAGDAVAVGDRIRAILAAAEEDPNGPLLVERFVDGAEVAVEGLLRGGRLEVLAVFDKPDPLDGPYFEETLYVTPSRHPQAVQDEAVAMIAAAAARLGLREGPVHAEARLTPAGPVFLELAARSIGGLCARALRFGAGISLEEVILRHAADLPLDDLDREALASGVMMLPIPAGGILAAVEGTERAREVPGVVGLDITIPRGQAVRALPEGDRYLGFVFARGADPAAVEQSLRAAHRRLDVRIDRDGDLPVCR